MSNLKHIKSIEDTIKRLESDRRNIDEHMGYYGTAEHIEIAIDALNKQISKTINIADEYIPNAKIGYCNCGERLISDQHVYCFKCGQKIKWQ